MSTLFDFASLSLAELTAEIADAWAARYFAQGNHRAPSKPRIRVKPRVRIVA